MATAGTVDGVENLVRQLLWLGYTPSPDNRMPEVAGEYQVDLSRPSGHLWIVRWYDPAD